MASIRDEIREMARGWRWGRRPLVPRSAEPYAPKAGSKVFPSAWARTPAAKAARAALLRYGLKPVVWNEVYPQVEGLDVLDDLEPPVMFISNHSSHLDASIILTSLPPEWREKTATAAAADYFFDTWYRSIFTGLVYNGFPIERAGGGGRATTTARDLVGEGWNLIIFPEGSRTRDGWMQRFRHGASRLCLELQVPVVPIGIRGATAAMPPGRAWPLPGRPVISVRYGRPVRPEQGETHQALSLRLQAAVAQLLDEDRTTWWESLGRAAKGETPIPSGPAAPRWLRVWEGSRPVRPRGPGRAWRRGG